MELQKPVVQNEARMENAEVKIDQLKKCALILLQKNNVLAEEILKTQNVVMEHHGKFCQLVHQSNEFAQEVRTGNDGVLILAIRVEEIFDSHKKLESGYLGTRDLVGSIQESLKKLGNVSAQFRREVKWEWVEDWIQRGM